MSTKRLFEIKLLSYADAAESNDPDEKLFDNKKTLSGDLGDETVAKVDLIPASSTDLAVELGATAIKVLYIENLSSTLSLKLKLNGGSEEHILGPDGIFYMESAVSSVGQITGLTVTNESSTDSVKIKLFAASA